MATQTAAVACVLVGLVSSSAAFLSVPASRVPFPRGNGFATFVHMPLGKTLQRKSQCGQTRQQVCGHVTMSVIKLDAMHSFSMDDINFERYVGQVSYTESMTVEGDSRPTFTDEGTLRGGAGTGGNSEKPALYYAEYMN